MTIPTAAPAGAEGYTAFSEAIGSMVRLAVEDLNRNTATEMDAIVGYNLSVVVVEPDTNTATDAVHAACDVLSAGDPSIYGVSFTTVCSKMTEQVYLHGMRLES